VAAGFPTTINPIYQNNLIPAFCDVDLDTCNVNVNDLSRVISKKTKAIILAHTLGNPFNLDVVKNFAEENKLWLIEDNCDALGAKWNNRFTGTFGDISTQSFYPPHHITTGEGGSINTNSPLIKKIIESLRDWGRDCWCESGHDNTCGKRFNFKLGQLPKGYDHKYIYSHIGYNLKITDLQSSIGIEQIDKLDNFIKSRRNNHNYYYKFFNAYKDYFILPSKEKSANPSWFGFMLIIKKNAPFDRNNIVQYLENKKIATRMLFGGNLLRQPAYINKKHRSHLNLANTDYLMSNAFWIGVYPGINKEMRQYVVDSCKDFLNKY